MIRIFTLVVLLASPLLAQVEVPMERESLTRRQRRHQRENIQTPLEGVLLAPIHKEKVEEPLAREDIAREPTRWERGQGDFDRLLDRLRSLFRRELTETSEMVAKVPEPPRLRPAREASRIRRFKMNRKEMPAPKQEKSEVQVLGLPQNHPAWLGPIPPGDRAWEKGHHPGENFSALRIRAWSRKDGSFRPLQVRIKVAIEEVHEKPPVFKQGGKEGLVVHLPRHHIYQVQLWAGEPLLPRTGYVSLTESHQDLIGEMLPWNSTDTWRAVALDLREAQPGSPTPDLASWKTCLEQMDLHFMGLEGPVTISRDENRPSKTMTRGDLIGWCLTTPRERPILPWQTLKGQRGAQLKTIGAFEPIPLSPPSPKGWLDFLQNSKRSGGVTFLKGIQKLERQDRLLWSPLALMLLSGDLPSGLILQDEGDWELYMELLSKGIRMACLRPEKVRWSGQAFGGDHLLKFDEGPRQVIKAFEEGKIVVGSGARINFRIFDRPGGNAMAGIGDRWIPPSGNQTYQLLPKLQFELDAQSEGLSHVELWVNGKRSQPTPLNRPLKRGEALFSFEGLKSGDFILAGLQLMNGHKIFTNPIFIGEDQSTRTEVPLRVQLPSSWKKGYLLLRTEHGLQEIEIEPGPPKEVATHLLSRLEIWSDKGEVKKITPLDHLMALWENSDFSQIREDPLAHWEAMEKFLPLTIDWEPVRERTAKLENK